MTDLGKLLVPIFQHAIDIPRLQQLEIDVKGAETSPKEMGGMAKAIKAALNVSKIEGDHRESLRLNIANMAKNNSRNLPVLLLSLLNYMTVDEPRIVFKEVREVLNMKYSQNFGSFKQDQHKEENKGNSSGDNSPTI